MFSPDGRGLGWRAYILLILLSLAFFLPGISTIPPVDRDEALFAQASKQMIETGNYTDIRFQQQARYKKPIGIYWLQTASVKLFSPQKIDAIWAYRIPSLIGAILSVVMTAAIGALFFGPTAGFLAAILMASCVVLNVEARLAKTDATLEACILISQYAMARAFIAPDKTGWLNALTFWTAQSIGFLIKGPILLLVTLTTLITVWIGEKRLAWFKSLRPAIGLPYALMLIVPWFVAIMLASKGEFASASAGHDLLSKIWQGQNRGILPPGLHLLAFAGVFFPGSLLALMAIPDTWKNKHNPYVRFLLGWIIPTWIVFELSLTKLPHYVMPTYPAIAILAAKALQDGLPALKEKKWRWLIPTATILWAIAGIGLASALVALPFLIDKAWSFSSIISSVLLLISLIAGYAFFVKRSENCVLVLSAGSFLFFALSFGVTFPHMQNIWLTRQIVQVAQAIKPCEELSIVSASYNEPSLVFMAGTKTEFTNDGSKAAELLRENKCRIAILDKAHEKAFLANFPYDKRPIPLANFHAPRLGSGRTVDLAIYRL